MNKYFIKEGYKDNPVITYSDNPQNYWTEQRIKNSREFQFHVYEYAAKIFYQNAFTSLLDIGAGPGTKISKFFDIKNLRLALIDQPGMDKIINKTLGDVDFYGFNLEDDNSLIGSKFDMIICSDVIEHVENPDRLLNIIKQHITNQGMIIVSTPDRDMRRGLNNIQSPNKAHVREWNVKEFKLYLESNGFNVIKQINLPLKRKNPVLLKIIRSHLFYRKTLKNDWYANQMVMLQLKNESKRPL